MSQTPASSEVEPVSKVSFRPINTEALVVSIRTIIPKPEEIVRMDTPKRSGSLDSKKKYRSSRSSSEKSVNKSTMTDYRKEISVASQTSLEETNPHSSTREHRISQHTPCLKHAAENISLKATDMPSEKLSLCNDCSKSMLSYIFLVQDFLDSLAKDICGGTESQNCVQCIREQIRQQTLSRADQSLNDPPRRRIKDSKTPEDSGKRESSKVSGGVKSKSSRSKDIRHGSEKKSKDLKHGGGKSKEVPLTPNPEPSPYKHVPNVPSSSFPPSASNQNVPNAFYPQPAHHQGGDNKGHSRGQHSNQNVPPGPPSASNQNVPNASYPHPTHHQGREHGNYSNQNVPPSGDIVRAQSSHPQIHSTPILQHMTFQPSSNQGPPGTSQMQPPGDQTPAGHPSGMFIKPMERQQPNFNDDLPLRIQHGDSDNSNLHNPEMVTSPIFSEGTGGIISGLSNSERDVYDSARDGAGWESLTEAQERLIAPDGRILSEAFVTMCRNNAEAIGCLVVGTSLLLTQTTRTLCVLVADGVSMAFREPLSFVFHVVQTVRSLDSLGTTKLALLEQPELGISFDKLNVWRLKQFHKCVYLNPDTLVIQNCDELFNREELSAVPDIGWPDCFNSGVFVFAPSDTTFWQLLEFSDKQGSYDGGDQGLLNSYFNSWSSDINKKLSFTYNLMANVSYTYTPAFRQFGKNVKIVQFHGSFKPWHVKFFNQTGLISPASNVHPTYVVFVNKWIKIFKGNALRKLSQEIQSYAAAQEQICAVELLRFFPLPSESEAEFFLTPPSVRLRLAELKLNKISKPTEKTQRRKSAEFPRKSMEDMEPVDAPAQDLEDKASKATEVKSSDDPASLAVAQAAPGADISEKVATERSAGDTSDRKDTEEDSKKIPGAEVGNYLGMKKWEQGKMDYQGTDSSDSIIKRLEFLMGQNK